jgi:hypothetical protein
MRLLIENDPETADDNAFGAFNCRDLNRRLDSAVLTGGKSRHE